MHASACLLYTSEIPVGATPRDVIQMMADEMNRYLTPAVKKQIQAQPVSYTHLITHVYAWYEENPSCRRY